MRIKLERNGRNRKNKQMKTYVFLADGFEEIEAISCIDILRRASVDVVTVSINETKRVCGAHDIVLLADCIFLEIEPQNADMLVLPGGMPGTKNLAAFEPLCTLLKCHDEQKGLIAAICAAPSIIGGLGLLANKKATCYPGFESMLLGAQYCSDKVIVSENIITAKGAGVAHFFALKLVQLLKGESVAAKIAQSICL